MSVSSKSSSEQKTNPWLNVCFGIVVLGSCFDIYMNKMDAEPI